MRWIVLALMMTSALAVPAIAGIGTPTTPRGHQMDECAELNEAAAGSCVQLPPGAVSDQSPVVVYMLTGRADGRVEIWQEDNPWTGLQRLGFYADGIEQATDLELL